MIIWWFVITLMLHSKTWPIYMIWWLSSLMIRSFHKLPQKKILSDRSFSIKKKAMCYLKLCAESISRCLEIYLISHPVSGKSHQQSLSGLIKTSKSFLDYKHSSVPSNLFYNAKYQHTPIGSTSFLTKLSLSFNLKTLQGS